MLLQKPELTIKLDYIPFIENITWDDIPATETLVNVRKLIRECDYIINDIQVQMIQRQAYMEFKEIELVSDEEELVKEKLKYYDWLSKVTSKIRSTQAKRYIYKEALTKAGYDN